MAADCMRQGFALLCLVSLPLVALFAIDSVEPPPFRDDHTINTQGAEYVNELLAAGFHLTDADGFEISHFDDY